MNKGTTEFLPVVSQNITEYGDDLEAQFMGLEVLPILPSDDKTASIPRWGVSNVTKSTGNLKRHPKTGYARIEHSPDKFTYDCQEYGLEEAIDDSDKKALKKFLEVLTDIAKFIFLHIRTQQEKRIADMTFNAVTFVDHTAAVSKAWTDPTAKIIKEVKAAKKAIKDALGGIIGVGEICVAVNESVFDLMTENDEIKALRGGGNGASKKDFTTPIGADEMARILGVDKVFYSCAKENGNEIWSTSYCLVYLRFKGEQLKAQPHIGRSVLWTDDSPTNVVAETYYSDELRSTVERVRQQLDEVVFTPAAGYLLSGISG